ncbi:hypothetical protein BABINDRAFT_18388, partial [Babjeviella inositovora NRRL Y-12698]
DHVNFINFNQDSSCISVGYNNGYKIFHCDPFGQFFTKGDGSVGIVEMLFNTSLIAVVGSGDQPPSLSPRRLKVINTKRQCTIVEVTFPNTILAVKMNRTRMVVLLEEQIFIYDIKTMRMLHSIETQLNPLGSCALSPDSDRNYLAYPSPPRTSFLLGSTNLPTINETTHTTPHSTNQTSTLPSRTGDVIIFNAETLQPVTVIEAHKSTISAMCLNANGTLLATASDKGTIVRVFQVETGTKLYQFRRGTYPTTIYSLSFSDDDRFITATSATETVHIFRLGEDEALANRKKRDGKSHMKSGKKLKPGRKQSFGSITEEVEETDEIEEEDEEDLLEAEDDSEVELVDDDESFEEGLVVPKRRSSSSGSLGSGKSVNGTDEAKSEPLIDLTRRSVARMIRRSSQTLGRKAAERMGTFLPSKFSSILEPTRHFASLKVPINKDVKAIASIGKEMTEEDLWVLTNHASEVSEDATSGSNASLPRAKLLHVMVITSDGYFYNYGLDPERGGDCILLKQYSLL